MNTTELPRRVSVIGLGQMGAALAEALLNAGHKVTVWNRTAGKADALITKGARAAGSAAEALSATEVTIICVSNHVATMEILGTVTAGDVAGNKLLVQLSTVTADESRATGLWAQAKSIAYLDGSIFGYPQSILNNDCTIIYSGPKRVFDINEPVLCAMGGKPKLVSEAIGGAPTFDKTIYANYYGSMLAFFHGAAICRAAGFPMEIYVDEVVAAGAGQRPRHGKMLVNRSYEEPGATMEIEAAAYDHVVKLSEALGIDTAFAKTVSEHFDRAIADGHGQHAFAAMVEVLTRDTNP